MSSYHLMVLGLLAAGGPMHGHRIRRYAVDAEVERWADVKVGSLYAALHRMEHEGLVEVVRREQEGRRPARTVYGITSPGVAWLDAERRAVLGDGALPPMAIDLAIAFGREPDVDVLRRALDTRRRAVEAYGRGLAERRERGLREGLRATTIAALRHLEHRVDAELAWMAELDPEALAAVAAREADQA
jgi:DNA-binding PadR family transcriptional regulator